MKGFCTITPSRGDRPEFLDFCKYQLSRMAQKPEHSYFIDYKPESKEQDLTERVMAGIMQAKADGFDYAFIIEDDDYYDADYFAIITEWQKHGAAFLGQPITYYYNLAYQGYTEIVHNLRSSLFTTGIRLHTLEGFDWYKAKQDVFLDIRFWEYQRRRKLPMFLNVPTTGPNAVGIKHGIGLCGGKGHTLTPKVDDFQREWLQANVDQTAYDFYLDMMRKRQWFNTVSR